MSCEHCHGLMLKDHRTDIEQLGGLMWLSAWHCVNCGHIVDPVTATHRPHQKNAAMTSLVHIAVIRQLRQEEQVLRALAA